MWLLTQPILRFCVLPTAFPLIGAARCDMDKHLSRSYPRGLNRIRPRAPLLTFVFESELFAFRQRELQCEELSQLPPARSTRCTTIDKCLPITLIIPFPFLQLRGSALVRHSPGRAPPARAIMDRRRRKRTTRMPTAGTAVRRAVPGASRQEHHTATVEVAFIAVLAIPV